jgi:hypothetical protein
MKIASGETVSGKEYLDGAIEAFGLLFIKISILPA